MKKPRDPSALGRMKRGKGTSYERTIANELKPIYPRAKRGIGQARAAHEVPDVVGVPFWVEAKHHKRVNIRKAYEQAVAASVAAIAARGAMLGLERARVGPVLVVSRDNGKSDLATMHLDTLLQLLRELESLRKAFDKEVER